ncbi:MarR family winged helix-turn-helix transcriptional regulator [Bartonella sp. HY329]|uniref:MarR family winged helix-turn-helix transcriptional regulator n=1 Tax=unclassified Bartonella TaxID=2645622 RepID=UPI0021CA1386|nr:MULTISPECIES: MarR family winged helix-turn-helix transcriptional regulator [unclassified Bartonella]UXM95918.1 MarR family winged helix-turn-helix transcriptional regulator [Bartonella sp. HY329]UXN10243.1 MarR family winged helix-turn-helix transcriptional regulator [Bartonella sp. HY328]
MPDRQGLLTKLQTTSRFLRTSLAQELQKEGLYPGQESVLITLSLKGDLTLGQLANELGVRPPTITKTVLRLSTQGFVQKNTSTIDHRQSFVSLTSKGINIVNELQTHLNAIEKAALDGIDNDEIILLTKLLQRIERNLV